MKKTLIAKRHQKQDLHDLSAFSSEASDELINLSIGDPDFTTPSAIIDAAFADAKSGHTHYTSGLGQQALRQAVCDDLSTPTWSVPLEQCMITTSACHAMWLVLEAMLDEGDEVIVFSPYFAPYLDQIKLARGVAVDCPTDPDNDFAIDPKRLQETITPRTKALIINTPNNPTGRCYDKTQLTQIADIAKQHDLIVLADDIYTAFSFDEPHIPIATLDDMASRTITLGSFSKNYCMTGWRIGYVIAPPELIRVMESINQNVIYSPPSISQRAALHAIALKDEVQPAIIDTIRSRANAAQRVFDGLKGVSCRPAQGGMYVFPDIRQTGLSAPEFAKLLLEQANIRVIAGDAFGQAGAGHIRVALTVSEAVFAEAEKRLHTLPLFQ